MLNNNNERLNIWLNLTDKCSYSEFFKSCENSNIKPLRGMEFAQKVGVILAGMSAHPELSPSEAYLRYLTEHQTAITGSVPPQLTNDPVIVPQVQSSSDCGSCGGGKVR